MVEINKEQKKLYAEKILDLANIAVGALVFGQFVSDKPFSLLKAIIGIIALFLLYMISFALTERK
jgi:hypothetical protein